MSAPRRVNSDMPPVDTSHMQAAREADTLASKVNSVQRIAQRDTSVPIEPPLQRTRLTKEALERLEAEEGDKMIWEKK